MKESEKLLNNYLEILHDPNINPKKFSKAQKSILQKAVAILKKGADAKADYVVGMIAINDGDLYKIPAPNALKHLRRAYSAGELDAGIDLADALCGVCPFIPEEYQDEDEAISILQNLSSKNVAEADYSIACLYMYKIELNVSQGGYPPETWYDEAEKHARKSSELGYCGGFLKLGKMHDTGFSLSIPQDFKKAFSFYQKAVEVSTGHALERLILADAKNSLGSMYYEGQGVGRDRLKGIRLVQEAADMGEPNAQEWLDENYHIFQNEGLLTEDVGFEYDLDLDDYESKDDGKIIKH